LTPLPVGSEDRPARDWLASVMAVGTFAVRPVTCSAGCNARGGIDYWAELKDSPSHETCFAIFANVLELDDQGEPISKKYADRRAATWLYRYCTENSRPV